MLDKKIQQDENLHIDFDKSFTIQDLDNRLEMVIWCCNTHGGDTLCCGTGNDGPPPPFPGGG